MGLENQGHILVLQDECALLRGYIEDPWTDPGRCADFKKALRKAEADLRREERRP